MKNKIFNDIYKTFFFKKKSLIGWQQLDYDSYKYL